MEAPLWKPDAGRIERASLTALLRETGFSGYQELHRWSVEEPDAFWRRLWEFTKVIGDAGGIAWEPGQDMASSRFFPEARLSIAENFLWRRGAEPALIASGERGGRRVISWDELWEQAARAAGALEAAGVRAGDRVAAWLPMVPELVVLLIAASGIGATFSSTSPDFGVEGVVDRFGQIEPKVLVGATGYQYGGKWFDCRERFEAIRRGLPSLREVVMVGDAEEGGSWERWTRAAEPIANWPRFPFDHPWLVLYSSGTTGKPKCIVHRAGGVFLNLKKEHVLHCDVREGDRVMYYTTAGWMMFNWLVNALAAGATVVLYDGNPLFPHPARLLRMAREEGLTLLGVSAKFLDHLRKTGVAASEWEGLEHLRTICSTGSPLSAESFRWVYSQKRDVHLASISGGTDICGCFLLGSPIEPVYAGELQRPGLGMAADVFNERGESLRRRPGVCGELVCTRAFPSQPLGFWGDEGGRRYRAAYFEKFPGVWAHGDFASWTEHGGMIIHGRSDATLKPGGVRIGTGEIYRVVEQIAGIWEALAIGQEWEGDVRIVLLVRLAPGGALSDLLREEIRRRIRASCTPRHVPALIVAVDDLPRTRSNKLVELAVADAVHGREVRNLDAIENPEALWAAAEAVRKAG
jgi:acetoacetyl-CoA synthetase